MCSSAQRRCSEELVVVRKVPRARKEKKLAKRREKKEKEGKKSGIEKKLVIQGSHMVSGTRCPAWSDQVKKWKESRAAAPKGRCPVGHRGEFPDVLRYRWLI